MRMGFYIEALETCPVSNLLECLRESLINRPVGLIHTMSCRPVDERFVFLDAHRLAVLAVIMSR